MERSMYLVKQLERIANALEKQNEMADKLMKVFPDEVLDIYGKMIMKAIEEMEELYD